MEQNSGRVTFYDPQANFGFIDPDDHSGDVIFSIRPNGEQVEVGDYVYYELVPNPLVTPMGKQALRIWKAAGAGAVSR